MIAYDALLTEDKVG